jgi:lipoprotein-anchoring transpeptidase ErfK/SrfK
MMPRTPFPALLLAAGLALAALAADAAPAPAQQRRPQPTITPTRQAATPPRVSSEALRRGRYAVVIDLDANRLYFAKGRRVLWSAPVGTGTGMRMEGDDEQWDFATPNGTFHVRHKALDPVWIAPDWYFLENNLPVPSSDNDPKRRFPGGLGSAAVYIGHGLAIHGTDKPELLGQRVSHGCIRLHNRDALRLYHDVQPGTEVVIVGGEDLEPTPPPARTASRNRAPGPPPREPELVARENTETWELLERLDDELFAAAAAPGQARWPLTASVLINRGIGGDDDALAGVLGRAARLGRGTLRDEYATFLADAYQRATLRTLDVLATLDPEERGPAATAIVEATVGHYPGELTDPVTPWPTSRAPREVISRAARRGWDALQRAEDGLRASAGLPTRSAAAM